MVLPKRLIIAILASGLIGALHHSADAGWPFFRKSNDVCSVCEQEQPKQKKKPLMSAEDAPASAVVDLIPARYTTVRAERQPPEEKKDTPASADDKKMQELDQRMKALDLKVNQLSLEIEALIHVMENKK